MKIKHCHNLASWIGYFNMDLIIGVCGTFWDYFPISQDIKLADISTELNKSIYWKNQSHCAFVVLIPWT